MSKFLSIVIASLFIASCSKHPPHKQAVHTHCVDIEGGAYSACYGPEIIFNDPVPRIHSESNNKYLNYQISVRQPIDKNSEKFLFHKELPLSEVDSRLINERDADVVTYDSKAKTVHFNLGVSKVTYTIGASAGL